VTVVVVVGALVVEVLAAAAPAWDRVVLVDRAPAGPAARPAAGAHALNDAAHTTMSRADRRGLGTPLPRTGRTSSL
jgi:hypothetical protein